MVHIHLRTATTSGGRKREEGQERNIWHKKTPWDRHSHRTGNAGRDAAAVTLRKCPVTFNFHDSSPGFRSFPIPGGWKSAGFWVDPNCWADLQRPFAMTTSERRGGGEAKKALRHHLCCVHTLNCDCASTWGSDGSRPTTAGRDRVSFTCHYAAGIKHQLKSVNCHQVHTAPDTSKHLVTGERAPRGT